jgi:hypothetical protein
MHKLKTFKAAHFFHFQTAIGIAVLLFLNCTPTFAGVSFNFGGNSSTNYAGDRSIEESSYSLGLTVDVLTMVRLSYGYKHRATESSGRYLDDKTGVWVKYIIEEYEDTHSANVILVLFETQFLAPYVFGGMARKTSEYSVNYIGVGKLIGTPDTMEVPQYGIGVGIQFSQSFSLKLSNTWTEILAKDFDTETEEVIPVKKQASEFEISASYKL